MISFVIRKNAFISKLFEGKPELNFNKIAVIMAGGTGFKLWPKSTEKLPKQFLHMLGEGTMIENTVARLLPFFKSDDIYIVTTEIYRSIVEEQLPLIPKDNIIIEPFGKNTAPCIALALSAVHEKYSQDTVIMAFPADHVINNVREFQNSLEIAGQTAYSKGGIVTIGITPTRAETAYGYIQVKSDPFDLGEYFDNGVRYSATFAEKPDKATAKRFMDSGDFLWNSGIFIVRIDTFWMSFKKFLPEHNKLFKIIKKTVGKEMYWEAVLDAYKQMNAESLDYAILEKADNVFVVESAFGWSDLGSWDELYRLSMKDARNNVIMGDVITSGISNSFIMSSGRMIGIAGVDNLIVVDSEDSLLILKRGKSEDVQEIIDYMKRKQINHYL